MRFSVDLKPERERYRIQMVDKLKLLSKSAGFVSLRPSAPT